MFYNSSKKTFAVHKVHDCTILDHLTAYALKSFGTIVIKFFLVLGKYVELRSASTLPAMFSRLI